MRKGVADSSKKAVSLSTSMLDKLQKQGYKFVQIKGFSLDKHYDYMEPSTLLLIPMKKLPTDPFKKDIYEPINSKLLYKWAGEVNEHPEILIAQQ